MAFWLLLFTRLYQVNELRREPNCSSSAPVIYGFMYLGYLLDSPLNIKQRSSRLFEGHRGSRLKLWFRICRLRNSIARTEINLFTKPRVVISIEIITWISTAGGTMHSDTWLDPKTKNSRESMPLKPEERQVGFRSYSRQNFCHRNVFSWHLYKAAFDKWSPVLAEIFDDLDKDKSGFASMDEMWLVPRPFLLSWI